jgi:hypothetical protein
MDRNRFGRDCHLTIIAGRAIKGHHLPNQNWTPAQLADLTDREELVLVIARADRPALRVPVWPVTVGNEVYVRSYKGVTSGWYRGVLAQREQAVALTDGDTAVFFESVDASDEVNAGINEAYLSKYSNYDYRDAMVTPLALDATLRILPAD